MTGRPPTANTVRPVALPDWVELWHALTDVSTPCQRDPDPFCSEARAMRIEAAQACHGCPVFGPCGNYAAAQGETFGVWGGVDRSPRARQPLGERKALTLQTSETPPPRSGSRGSLGGPPTGVPSNSEPEPGAEA